MSKLNPNDDKSKEMDMLILKFMCWNCHPLSFTEQPGFEEMINYAFPRYYYKIFYMHECLIYQ